LPALFKKCWKWILLSLILLLAVVYCCLQAGDKTAVNPNAVGNTLSPRDQFISQTYFSHLYYYPDPDESLELLQEHVQGQDLLGAGKYDEAVVLFKSLVKKYPGARHANEGLAIALKERYNRNGDFKDLQASSEYFIKSIQKALEVNTVPVISLQVGADLGLLGETTKFNDIFQQLDRRFPDNGPVALNYAQGLTAVDDPRAGEWFNKAVEQKADSAPSEYSEWLLDRQRYTDALITLDAALDLDADNMDLHFLKG